MAKSITVKSMVGARTGEPAVMFRFGGEYVNMPPDEARKVAIDLIGAADRAELEAKLLLHLRKQNPRDGDAMAVEVIALLRAADEPQP